MEKYIDSGLRLITLRNLLNLTQTEFSDQSDVNRASLSAYENGKSEISKKSAEKICRKFNVSMEWLMEGVGEIFNSKDYPDSSITNNVDEQMNSYNSDTIAQLLEQNNRLVQQVSDLIKMQLLNAESIRNLSSYNVNHQGLDLNSG